MDIDVLLDITQSAVVDKIRAILYSTDDEKV